MSDELKIIKIEQIINKGFFSTTLSVMRLFLVNVPITRKWLRNQIFKEIISKYTR